jgi:hypothetical protein
MLKPIQIFFLLYLHAIIMKFDKWMSKMYFYIGNLQEDVYVTQLESFGYEEFINKLCKL